MPSDGSYQTAEGSSRKRLKTNSRDAGRPAGYPSKSPEVVSLISSTPAKPQNNASTELLNQVGGQDKAAPCAHESSLRTLHGDLDTMRQLITCKICQRFLYEPYALTCGHTFCYSCLSQWMGQNQKKTCPDCRMVIKEQPAPSYLIRELVVIFTSKSELLPDGETAEEHGQMAKEEASIVATDKSNTDVRTGGLFKGCFKKGNNRTPLVAIRDHNDNVDRCPQCLHEVEDGRCNLCNVRVRNEDDDSDLDFSDDDDDTDEELDQELLDDLARDADADLAYDDYSDFAGYGGYGGMPNIPISDTSDDDEEEMRQLREGFIVDDDEPVRRFRGSDDGLSDSEVTEVEAPRRRYRRQAPIVLSDDEEEEEEEEAPRAPPSRRRGFRSARRLNSEEPSIGGGQASDSDDDEDEPVRPSSQRNRNRIAARMTRRPTTIVSDPSDDDSDDSDDSESETQTDNQSVTGGFSPLQYAEHENDPGATQYLSGYFDGPPEEDDEEGYGNAAEQVDLDDGYGYAYEDGDDDGMSNASDEQSIRTSRRAPQPDFSHRLHTLGPRRNRHADPLPRSPFRSLMDTFNFRRQPAPDTQPFRSPSAAYRPVRPAAAHPFNLDNTLASIRRNQLQQSSNRSANRHTNSRMSSQSEVGGVDVRPLASGSSGSSRTLRADDGAANGHRRGQVLEVDLDSDDSDDSEDSD